MKKYVLALLAVCNALILTTATAKINIASYNVTHGNKNNWPKREPNVCEVIKQLKADIYGFQEVIKKNNQLKALKTALSNYNYVGKPRSSGIQGLSLWHRLVMLSGKLGLGGEDESCPIFYNKDTLACIAEGTFGINGKGWTSALLPRICTWAHFKEIATQKEFYVYNTHLDNKEKDRRIMQMKLIIDDIIKRCGNTPVILMGDFNTTFTNDMQKNLSDAGFTHGRQATVDTEGPITTHIKGKPFEIDHILVKPKSAFKIFLYKVLNTISKKTSDHNPVSITFSLN
jgi:endonuclease/exonuclease/phosphatase family metal-dependent hydrolase